MAAAGLVPIRIEETRGCSGHVDLRGRLEGLCVICELQGRDGEQVAPLVARNRQGVNDCPNFRSTGAVHVTVDGGSVVVLGGTVVDGGTVVLVVVADVVVGGSVVVGGDVVIVGGSVVGTVVGVGLGSVAEAAISKANRMKMIPVRMTSRWRTVRIPER